MRTLHVGLRVADLQRSLGFYPSLGYEVLGTVPETELGSLSHVVIQVGDVHAPVAHLRARGVPAEEPDGCRIELVQWPDGHPDGITRADLADWAQGDPRQSGSGQGG